MYRVRSKTGTSALVRIEVPIDAFRNCWLICSALGYEPVRMHISVRKRAYWFEVAVDIVNPFIYVLKCSPVSLPANDYRYIADPDVSVESVPNRMRDLHPNLPIEVSAYSVIRWDSGVVSDSDRFRKPRGGDDEDTLG